MPGDAVRVSVEKPVRPPLGEVVFWVEGEVMEDVPLPESGKIWVLAH